MPIVGNINIIARAAKAEVVIKWLVTTWLNDASPASSTVRRRGREEGGCDDKGKGKGDNFIIVASCPFYRTLTFQVGVVDRERARAIRCNDATTRVRMMDSSSSYLAIAVVFTCCHPT